MPAYFGAHRSCCRSALFNMLVFVAVDSVGVVGAFSSLESARSMLGPYARRYWVCVLAKWEVSDACANEISDPNKKSVFVLPYTAKSLPAFVGTHAEALSAQRQLGAVGLVPEDDPEFWEVAVDALIPLARRRLDPLIAEAPDKNEEAALTEFMGMAEGNGGEKNGSNLPFLLSAREAQENIRLVDFVTGTPVELPAPGAEPGPPLLAGKDG